MGVADKLKNVGNYVRTRWRSTDPDSYDQYRRGREREREQAEQTREDAERHGEEGREEVERGREYDERYRAEQATDEPRTEAARGDSKSPE